MSIERFKRLMSSEKVRECINNNDYDELYDYFNDYAIAATDIGQLTEFLYKCGINPLSYFNKALPRYFLINVDVKNLGFGHSLNIPGRIEKIQGNAFRRTEGIKELYIEEGVKSVKPCLLWSDIRLVYLPNTLTEIDDTFFAQAGNVVFYLNFSYLEFKEKFKHISPEVITSGFNDNTYYFNDDGFWKKY